MTSRDAVSLSLLDALPICRRAGTPDRLELLAPVEPLLPIPGDDEERIVDPHRETDHRDHVLHEEREVDHMPGRSEEHTSELQSPCNIGCRLLLDKKNRTRR